MGRKTFPIPSPRSSHPAVEVEIHNSRELRVRKTEKGTLIKFTKTHRMAIGCFIGWCTVAVCFGVVIFGRRKDELISCSKDSTCRGGEICDFDQSVCVNTRNYIGKLVASGKIGTLVLSSSTLPESCVTAATAQSCTLDATKTTAIKNKIYEKLAEEAVKIDTLEKARIDTQLPEVCGLCTLQVPESVSVTLTWGALELATFNDNKVETALQELLQSTLSAQVSIPTKNIKKVTTSFSGSSRRYLTLIDGKEGWRKLSSQLSVEYEIILEYTLAPKTGGVTVTGPYGIEAKDSVTASMLVTTLNDIGNTDATKSKFKDDWLAKVKAASASSAINTKMASVTLTAVTSTVKSGSKDAFSSMMSEVSVKYNSDVKAKNSITLSAKGGYAISKDDTLVFETGLSDAYMCFKHGSSNAVADPTCVRLHHEFKIFFW